MSNQSVSSPDATCADSTASSSLWAYRIALIIGLFILGFTVGRTLASEQALSAEDAFTSFLALSLVCVGSSHAVVSADSTAGWVLSRASIAFAVAGLVSVFFVAS